jgi:hypothetical protein
VRCGGGGEPEERVGAHRERVSLSLSLYYVDSLLREWVCSSSISGGGGVSFLGFA